ncbi:DUF29 domain-containing protein [Methylobacterium sp. SyP6R]|uniref:DUF29 domain-containing protein n=1 Tax=Methylobacterium sp. SyP6R TaxID=2718876 RepID=UPI001F429C4A|nr:DUF29 domain-containing protein [Methylobacterium sp. SyP6R]MCF4127379.1 DUF29 domain-containing protein [Methylobacterium sp. SyP6R]
MTAATRKPKPAPARPAPPLPMTAYADDIYGWAMEQAAALRTGNLSVLDRENLAEEIESLGRSEFNRLVSFYALVQLHMLKWHHQPSHRCASWAVSISTHRKHVSLTIADNPSLKSRLDEAFERAYLQARHDAIRETGFAPAIFPIDCPFTRDEAMSLPFLYE